MTRPVLLLLACTLISGASAATSSEPEPLTYAHDFAIAGGEIFATGANRIWHSTDGRDFTAVAPTNFVGDQKRIVATPEAVVVWSEYGLAGFKRGGGGMLTLVSESSEEGIMSIAAGPRELLAATRAGELLVIDRTGKLADRRTIDGARTLSAIQHDRAGWVAVGGKVHVPAQPTTPPPGETSPGAEGAADPEAESEDDYDDMMASSFDTRPPEFIDGAIWTSLDGVTWKEATLPQPSGTDPEATSTWGRFDWLLSGPRGMLAISDAFQGAVSHDGGRSWTVATVPEALSASQVVAALATAEGFLLVTHSYEGDAIHRSTDGRSWQAAPLPRTAGLTALKARGSEILALGRPDSALPYSVRPLAEALQPWQPASIAASIAGLRASPGSEVLALQAWPLTSSQKFELGTVTRIRPSEQGYFFIGEFGVAEGPQIDIARPAFPHLVRGWARDAIDLPNGVVAVLRGTRMEITGRTMRDIRQVEVLEERADLKSLARISDGVIAVGSYGTLLGWVGGREKRWTAPAPLDLRRVAAGQGVAVAIESSDDGKVTDGVLVRGDTVERLGPRLGSEPVSMADITFTGSEFVIVGAAGLVLRSSDGLAWRAFDVEGRPDFRFVHAAGGRVFASTADLRIFTSADGRRWAPVALGADSTKTWWRALASEDGCLVVLAHDGRLVRLPTDPAPLADAPALVAVDRAEAARAREAALVAEREAAERARIQAARERERAYARLKAELPNRILPLSRLALLEKFTAAHGTFTAAEAEELAPELLKDFTPAKGYLFATALSDEVMKAILQRLTADQRAAMRLVADGAEGRASPGRIARPPAIDVSGLRSATSAQFDVAFMEKRASYRATSDESYVGAAYDMAIAYAEGWGVEKNEGRARSHMHLAEREGIRYQPRAGEAGHGAPTGAGGVNLYIGAHYGSTLASVWYADEFFKKGKEGAALVFLREAAIRRHHYAGFRLAESILVQGDVRGGTAQEAFDWLVRGTQAGHADSAGLLGYAILYGLGVEADPAAARPYLEASARLGSSVGAKTLASLDAWEKDRAAMWETLAQANDATNRAFAGVEKAMSDYASDMQTALAAGGTSDRDDLDAVLEEASQEAQAALATSGLSTYEAGLRNAATAQQRIADIVLRERLRVLTPDEAETDHRTLEALRTSLASSRDADALAQVFARMRGAGSLPVSEEEATLRVLALGGFKAARINETVFGSKLDDPATAKTAPVAHIRLGRALYIETLLKTPAQIAATLPAWVQLEYAKVGLGFKDRPSVAPDSAHEAAWKTHLQQLDYFSGLAGDSLTGLDLVEALRPWHGHQPALWAFRGEFLARQGRREDAIKSLTIALVLDPQETRALAWLKRLQETEPALWLVPEEAVPAQVPSLLPVIGLGLPLGLEDRLGIEAAARTMGRRLTLASRADAARRARLLPQILALHPGLAGAHSSDTRAALEAATDAVRSALAGGDMKAVEDAAQKLPLAAACTAGYWATIADVAAKTRTAAEALAAIDIALALDPAREPWARTMRTTIEAAGTTRFPRLDEPFSADLARARQAAALGDAAGVTAAVEAILGKTPDHPPALLLKARLLAAQGHRPAAARLLDGVATSSAPSVHRARAFGMRALIAIENYNAEAQGRIASTWSQEREREVWAELAALAAQAFALDPLQPEMNFAFALTSFRGNETSLQDPRQRAAAIRFLDAAIFGRPDFIEALAMRGQVLSFDGRIAEAAADFETILALVPAHHQLRTQVISLYAEHLRCFEPARRHIDELERQGVREALQFRARLNELERATAPATPPNP